MSDWYRKKEWTPEASREFERQLSRSRSQKSEYLRIQALTLADSLNEESANSAIDLARRFLSLKESGVGVAQMHAAIAKAYSTLGNAPEAIKEYKEALKAELKWPNSRGYHYLDFAWFVVTHEHSSEYEEALLYINSNKQDQDLIFPENQYRYFGALALIAAAQGDMSRAQDMAKNSLSAKTKKRGPFEHLPFLGLVKSDKDKTHARLKDLAG